MQDNTENILEEGQGNEVVPERKKLPPLVFILARQASLLREVEENYGEIDEEIEEELEMTKELFDKKWPAVLFVKDTLEAEIAVIEKYIEDAKKRIKARQNRINTLTEGLIAGVKMFGEKSIEKATGKTKSYFIIDPVSGRKLNVLSRETVDLSPNFEEYVRTKIITRDLEDISLYYSNVSSSIKINSSSYVELVNILKKRKDDISRIEPNIQDKELKLDLALESHYINVVLNKLTDFTVTADKKALLKQLKAIDEKAPTLFDSELESEDDTLISRLASISKTEFLK